MKNTVFSLKKATLKDARKMQELINFFAARDLMMPRSLNELFENIRDFWVIHDSRGRLLGCAALHVVGWEALAEIKSLAVTTKAQRKGVGRQLIEACVREADGLKINSIFALTYKKDFFKKFGFRIIAKSKLPHKVWAECCNCPKFPKCNETAVIKRLKK